MQAMHTAENHAVGCKSFGEEKPSQKGQIAETSQAMTWRRRFVTRVWDQASPRRVSVLGKAHAAKSPTPTLHAMSTDNPNVVLRGVRRVKTEASAVEYARTSLPPIRFESSPAGICAC